MVVSFMFSELRWEFRFVYIDEIVDHHHLNFSLLIIITTIYKTIFRNQGGNWHSGQLLLTATANVYEELDRGEQCLPIVAVTISLLLFRYTCINDLVSV